jgi:8-oxo-dGTP pyrophosphatase MutT (NUDIX family)
MGGALVFPGGKVDPGDHDDAWHGLTTELRPRARKLAAAPSVARAYAVAALREALEEAAILPVVGDSIDADSLRTLRKTVQGPLDPGIPALASVLRGRGLTLDTGRLEALSRWITPEFESKRFDTRFYLLEMPAAQIGEHDDHETTQSFWASPREILSRWERGEVMLAPPTSWTISLFVDAGSVDAAFDVARSQPLGAILPVLVNEPSGPVIVIPGDPLHPDPALFGPEVPTRFVMQAGRFVAQKP